MGPGHPATTKPHHQDTSASEHLYAVGAKSARKNQLYIGPYLPKTPTNCGRTQNMNETLMHMQDSQRDQICCNFKTSPAFSPGTP